MRLIDADALRRKMYHEAFETDTDMQRWDSGCWIRYKLFEKVIEQAPAADVRENVHAHWYHKPETYGAFCSNCHSWQYPDIVFQNFCPSCGAIMDIDGGVDE